MTAVAASPRIPFYTGRKQANVGYPLPAEPCACGCRRLVHDDTCCLCGRYERHVISATWARQAERRMAA